MASILSRGFTLLRGLLYAAGFTWLWSWVALSLRRYDSQLPIPLPTSFRPVGYGLAAAGALLALACLATFAAVGRGTPAPFDPPRAFVAVGPYRWVRNPMYLGAAAVIFGAGLIVASPAIVLLAPGFLLLMHLIVVFYEEPVLEAQFGDDYRRYKASANRWLVRKPDQRR